MLHALVTLAATEHESSHVAFYALGGALVVFALVVAGIGIARHETFPPTAGVARAVMGIAAILVVATCASAVVTA